MDTDFVLFSLKMAALRSILKKANTPTTDSDCFEKKSNNVKSTEPNCSEDKNENSSNEKPNDKPIEKSNEQSTIGTENASSTNQKESPEQSVSEKQSDTHEDKPSLEVKEESQDDNKTNEIEDFKDSFKRKGLKRKQSIPSDGQLALKYFKFIKRQSIYLHGPDGPHHSIKF